MKKAIGIAIVLLSIFSCDPKDKVKAPGLREEVENRKIKRITDAEIQQRALLMGDSLAQMAQNILGGALQNAVKNNGITEAIQFCNVQAYPLLADLQAQKNVTIRRVSLKHRNPDNAPNTLEAQLLEAFAYNVENGLETSASVQQQGSDYYYVKPIFTQALCLNCHGAPEKNIAPDNMALLRSLYPDDKATGYDVDQLRGMWSIKIPKKEIVLAISDDTWKPKYKKRDAAKK